MTRIFFLIILISGLQSGIAQIPQIPFSPQKYIVYKTSETLCIDGKLDEDGWNKTPWTNQFVNIEGFLKPLPEYETKVKILWDESYLYIGVWMEEPHIWATLTERESVIFHDNDFEIFIDPDGDTHNYIEYEINAFGTEWDLFMCKPYRDRCAANSKWNIEGVNAVIGIQGTINDPTDTDTCWFIEIAMPWKSLIEYSESKKIPIDGEQWRLNFARVQWKMDIINGKYVKQKDQSGKNKQAQNWVWSPQGVIAMHQPETWAYIQFSELTAGSQVPFINRSQENIKWNLRQLYYMQNSYYSKHYTYSNDYHKLQKDTCLIEAYDHPYEIIIDYKNYEISIPDSDNLKWIIRKDGKVWSSKY
ncbi:MAG: carbohydrate-binding family 9-like protein [Bacteroidetes bacterium]|nr:MAG: carbohydrate-binding family 9-like protein [Bacteroidota bacterium]